jgi:hypothetical protein
LSPQESLTTFLLVLVNDTKNNKMSTIYLHQPYVASTRFDTAGQRQVTLADNTTPGYYGEQLNVVPLASGPDTQYQLNLLKTEIDSLRNMVQSLQIQVFSYKPKTPLTQQQVEAITDEAYRAQTKSASEAHGQQISIFDGIESHVVRATERAHGIQ